jgi:putative hydrolases of HD superfamily
MVKDLSPFFGAAIALKSVKRAGWVAKAGISDSESVADHSFSMCAIGMALADAMKLDAEKVMKMIVLHDLAESAVGDYMPGQVAIREKEVAEDRAMTKILACLPADVQSQYAMIWQEFLAGRTRIARFVRRLDKLEMAMQAQRYLADGHDGKALEQFFESAKKAVNTEDDELAQILKALKPSSARKK